MREFTEQAEQTIYNLAQRYGTSPDAVSTLMRAVAAGGGSMAQFSHPDLGGSGQWMRGGMTMVSDMFNHSLAAKVSGICAELASFMASQPVFPPPPQNTQTYGQASNYGNYGNQFWPAELGQPSASGGQNDFRYAYFPAMCRLAVERGGQLSIYDTLDHQIGGVSQQQSGMGSSFTFSSQRGTFAIESLPLLQPQPQSQPQTQQYVDPPQPSAAMNAAMSEPVSARDHDEVFAALDRLGNLRDRGILTEEEFLSKKRELLARL